MSLSINTLPELNDSRFFANDLESTLLELQEIIESKYNNKILVVITTSSTYNDNEDIVLSYAVYLSFVNKNNFSYRLFELNCLNPDGGFPIEINAFTGQKKSFGRVYTKDELNTKISEVFDDPRTRNVILSNYKM